MIIWNNLLFYFLSARYFYKSNHIPAGFSILKGSFEDDAIHPLGLLVAALPPTFISILAFQLL
ncbi:MAG: putative Na+/H+ antiporter [Nitrosomonadaceae bacterium]